MTKSGGITTCTRSTEPSTVAVDSMLSFTHLMPTQTPAKRDRAKPSKPKSRISCTPPGLSTGIMASTKANSDWCAEVELSQV